MSTDSSLAYPDFLGLLTEEQRITVRRTWSFIRKDVKKNGGAVFVRFFEKYPDYQNVFKDLKNLPVEQLTENEKFIGHATSAFSAISTIIDEFEEPESATEDLFRIAASHLTHNVTVEMFRKLGKTMVEYLVDELGDHVMHPRAVVAWRTTWEAIVDVIAQGFHCMENTSDANMLKPLKKNSGILSLCCTSHVLHVYAAAKE